MEKRNAKALLPIAVFVVLYLGLGILFEYGLEIEMGFYKIPVVVIFRRTEVLIAFIYHSMSFLIDLMLYITCS